VSRTSAIPSRWLGALVVGGIAGAGSLVGGPIAGILALVAAVLVVARPPRAPAIGGLLIGIGGAWLLLFGRVAITCQMDCVAPDLGPWLAVAGVLTGLGVLVTARLARAHRPSS